MSLTLQASPIANLNLGQLIGQLEQREINGLCWPTWLQSATEQLETDDSIDARLTDELAETLAEADDALASGRNATGPLNRIVSAYRRAEQARPLEQRYREKAAGLGIVQLESRTWDDLNKALDAADAGRLKLVGRWIDSVEESFLAAWESYEHSDILADEITAESVLGHRLLREGIEGWLEALAELRDTLGQHDRRTILAQAEQGQRLLMVVQIVEQEAQDTAGRFLAAWTN